ncbi:MAG: hypothetical protein H6728_17930 [Myxococcales bacterium]|nr:hypothetical protein [Myxococcales bacterium]MCB9644956.1 hypothetical protein [Myxococcales bacterium]
MRKVLYGMVGLLAFWVVACGPPPAKLQLTLYYPYGEDGKTTFSQIQGFRIKVSGASLTDGSVSADFDSASGSAASVLSKIECSKEKDTAEQLDLQIQGLDGAGQIVALGRQTILNPCGIKRELSVFVGPVESFSALTKFEEGSTVPEQMLQERAGHQIRQLSDGRLLIVGGMTFDAQGGVGDVSNRIEIFDPETGKITDGIPMSEPRAFHSVTVLRETILIAGGLKLEGSQLVSAKSVDIFEITSEGLTKKGSFEMLEPRALHTTVITPTMNHFLVFGGLNYLPDGTVQMSQKWEIFDSKGSSIGTGDVPAEQQRAWHSANLLGDGRPFFAGGMRLDAQGNFEALASTLSLQYTSDDASVTLLPLPNSLKEARAAHTATRLLDGQIVVIGGMVPEAKSFLRPKSIVGSIQMFTALGEDNSQYSGTLKQPRTFHSAHLLEDGRLLVYGGATGPNSLADRTEIYTPNGLILDPEPLLVTQRKDRFLHAGTVLLNGALVILGGATLDPGGAAPFVALSRGEIFLPRPKP